MTRATHILTPVPDHDQEQRAKAPSTALQAVRIPAAVCLLQIVLAYEWLVSGLDKIGNAHFDSQLVTLLQQTTQGQAIGSCRIRDRKSAVFSLYLDQGS